VIFFALSSATATQKQRRGSISSSSSSKWTVSGKYREGAVYTEGRNKQEMLIFSLQVSQVFPFDSSASSVFRHRPFRYPAFPVTFAADFKCSVHIHAHSDIHTCTLERCALGYGLGLAK
jgi:hypothetical protein